MRHIVLLLLLLSACDKKASDFKVGECYSYGKPFDVIKITKVGSYSVLAKDPNDVYYVIDHIFFGLMTRVDCFGAFDEDKK